VNFEDIKDKLREQVMILWSQIQETPLWNKLSEEFGNLSPRKQKGVLIALVAMGILIVLMIPYSFYSSTSDTVTDFDRKRDLIRELFKVKRESAILENAPPSISGSELQSRAQMQISNAHLAPEQTRGVTDYDNAGPQASSIIPKIVIQKGTSVSLSKLTLKQVVDIGYLSTIVKLPDGEVTIPNKDIWSKPVKVVAESKPTSLIILPPGYDPERENRPSRFK